MPNTNVILNQAMRFLAAQPNAVFVGQSVAYGGTAMFADFDGIPMEQRTEFPVCEELQCGYCCGLSLQGFLPICVFPRIDFILRAADQLVNHLDKLEQMSRGQFCPKVIIRTRVGARTPLDAGPQHSQNHVAAFRRMLTNVDVFEILDPNDIMGVYTAALASPRSSLVVETLG